MSYYELTDTSTTMREARTGIDLGFHPIYVVEAGSEADALEQWKALTGKSDTSGVTVKGL